MARTVEQTLDLQGFSCPIPIVRTAQAMKAVPSGTLIEVLATDPGAVPDFTAWSKSTGNQLVERTDEGGVYRFVLRKR
jgi:tRNA 2-thiouridine synthesizing protein A